MKELAKQIKNITAADIAVMLVSGDTESLVTAALAARELGSDRLHAVHIDHGMLREGEKEAILTSLKNMGIKNIHEINIERLITVYTTRNAKGKIIGPISTVYNPFEKRELIDSAVKAEFDAFVSKNFPDAAVLGADGGLEEKFSFEDALNSAMAAGAEKWLLRQPFPREGLGVRILCNDSAIAISAEQRSALKQTCDLCASEFSARLIPFRSVCCRDGIPSYKCMVAISQSGVESDFIKAANFAESICEKLDFISRVLIRIDDKDERNPYHGAQMSVTEKTISAVRNADKAVEKAFSKTGAFQFFAVLLPFVEDNKKKYSVAIRAVNTSEQNSAKALVPCIDFDKEILVNAIKEIKALQSNVDMVFYDITSAPPSAIEFE